MKALLAAIFVLIALMALIAFYPGFQQLPLTDKEVTISGTLVSEDRDPGTIYILALYPVVLQKIREVETEVQPYASRHVVAYTTISAPGSYSIRVPKPGEYFLYAWKDTNGDGGIDHEDYLEPAGWYRTDDYLLPTSVDVTDGNDVSGIDLTLLAPTPYPDEELSVSRGSGGGTLKTIKGYPVLQLRGTDEERAYAQGYLVGPQIRDWVEYVLIEYYARSPSLYENDLLPFIRDNFSANDPYIPVADAMIQGMRDSETSMRIDVLKRDITRDDILAINALYCMVHLRDAILNEEKGEPGSPMCSNAVVWGNLTRNDELSGGLIHGKNMDGENDLRKVTVNTLLIVATEPEEGSGKMRVVGIDWPGFYGTYNAMNEEGLILVTHSVGYGPNFSATDLLEYSTLYMETLQHCRTIPEAEAYWMSRDMTRTGGWNTAVSVPYKTDPNETPSVTFESDSYGMAVRRPGDVPPTGIPAILTTNSFYTYNARPDAEATADGGPGSILPTHYRYIAMNDTLNRFINEGRSIGTPEMIEILRAASNSTSYSGATEYSYIGYPDTMSFAVAREDLERKILDASYAEYTAFSFEEVFQ
ncbi:hypothetical protein DIC75_05015 [Methanoculleus sp. CWC-02]|uniref:Uncharacterized protein n=2 Tax=Methanoculleus oceani TaxID=2184756 RepID=A0ABD4TAT3_9EURY|nr:hypothetical protein [Methanoculleus sp. CWC-02]